MSSKITMHPTTIEECCDSIWNLPNTIPEHIMLNLIHKITDNYIDYTNCYVNMNKINVKNTIQVKIERE